METLPEKFDFVSPFGGHVRVVMLGDEPWFIAKDVCDCLDIRTDNLRSILDEDEVTEIPNPYSIGVGLNGGRAPLILSEPGLYSLILKSRKEEAKAFKRWVTHDVIPSIRKTGGYALPRTMQDALRCLADSLDREAANRELIAKQTLAIETAKDALCSTEAQRDKAIREKAWINSSRSGRCMRKVRTANEEKRKVEAENGELKIKLSEAADWKTVTAMNKELRNFFYKLDRVGRQRIGQKVKTFSEVLGLPIKRAVDLRFGEVNAYHIEAWKAFFQFLWSPESASFMAAWRRD